MPSNSLAPRGHIDYCVTCILLLKKMQTDLQIWEVGRLWSYFSSWARSSLPKEKLKKHVNKYGKYKLKHEGIVGHFDQKFSAKCVH